MRIEKAAGALGAYVTNVSLARVAESGHLIAEIKTALNDHGVLFFRDQELLPEEFAIRGVFWHVGRPSGLPESGRCAGVADFGEHAARAIENRGLAQRYDVPY